MPIGHVNFKSTCPPQKSTCPGRSGSYLFAPCSGSQNSPFSCRQLIVTHSKFRKQARSFRRPSGTTSSARLRCSVTWAQIWGGVTWLCVEYFPVHGGCIMVPPGDSSGIGNTKFRKLKYGSVIIGCWGIQWNWLQWVLISVDIPTFIKLHAKGTQFQKYRLRNNLCLKFSVLMPDSILQT